MRRMGGGADTRTPYRERKCPSAPYGGFSSPPQGRGRTAMPDIRPDSPPIRDGVITSAVTLIAARKREDD